MTELFYLIYILAFVIGTILGLLLSYKKYSLPFVIDEMDNVALIISIIGWILLINSSLIPIIPQELTITLSLFLVSLIIGMRPGYGRKETYIGIIIAGLIYLLRFLIGGI